jgi:KUP system potassium uptake protein
MHSLKHYKVLHEQNVILTIETADMPRVDPAERVRIEAVGDTFSRVALRFGFMETPNVPKALAIARKHGWHYDIMSTSFFLSRRALKPAAHSGMPRWGTLVHHADPMAQRHRLFQIDRTGGGSDTKLRSAT